MNTEQRKKTIVIVAGYWSTNIGNAFFQLGAEYILKQIFPHDNVISLYDQPGYWDTKQGNPPNAFNLLDHIKPDYLVILGPFLRKETSKIWSKTLEIMKQRGTKIIVLGAGMMRYDKEEIAIGRQIMKKFPPYIFATRDRQTYELFADLAENSYDGIDPAFFVSDLYQPLPLDLLPYVVFNFDQIPEPKLEITQDKSISGTSFEFAAAWWNFKFPALRLALSKKFKAFPFVEALLPGIGYNKKAGDYMIIRTDHRFNPMFLKKTYKAPNSFVADFPYSYLNIYAQTEATFSNRVHACVATLAYGNSAMLFNKTPRVGLLERVGLKQIKQQPQKLDLAELKREKHLFLEFLRQKLT